MFVKSVKRVCLSFLIIALLFTGVASAGQAFTSLEAYAASDVKAKVKKSTKKIRTYSVSFGWRNEQVTASFKVKLKDPKKLYSIGEATLTLSGKNQTLSVPPTVRQKVRYKIGRKWYIKNITFKLKKITTTKDFQPMQWIDLSKAKLGDYYQSNINIPIFQPIRYNGALYCLHYYEYWEHINGDNWVDEIFGNEVAYHWVRKCVLAGTVSKSDAKHLDKYDKQAVKAVLKFWQANKGATPIEYAKAAFQYVHDIPYGWYYGSPEAGPESVYSPLYEIFVGGMGVCGHKATAFYFLMSLANIPCRTVVNCVNDDDECHAWNIVNLDGTWYHVDATTGIFLASDSFMEDANPVFFGKDIWGWKTCLNRKYFPACPQNYADPMSPA